MLLAKKLHAPRFELYICARACCCWCGVLAPRRLQRDFLGFFWFARLLLVASWLASWRASWRASCAVMGNDTNLKKSTLHDPKVLLKMELYRFY